MIEVDDPAANKIIGDVISGLDRELGSDIGGYYLIGSLADGTAVPLSDVDLVVILKSDAAHDLHRQGCWLGA